MLNINPVMPQTAGNLKSSKSNHPAFTSKLSLGDGAYDAVVKTFNEAKPYKKTNLFKGIITVSYTHLTLPTNREV